MAAEVKVESGSPEADCAAARCGLFRCFAEAFSSPTDDFLERLFSGGFLEELMRLGDRLPYPRPFESISLIPAGMTRHDVRVFFASCFESGGQGVPLRESAYSSQPEKAVLEDVLRFYQHFGLELSRGELREPPDSLAVELEFLHYLSYLESLALARSRGGHNAAALRRAQQDFTDRHLGKWVRLFMLKLKGVPDNGLYAGLADLMASFIEAERSHRPRAS